jgi:hypothetical protein
VRRVYTSAALLSSEQQPPGSSEQGSSYVPIADVKSVGQLDARHRGLYYPVDETRIAEAFTQWYTNREQFTSKTVNADGGGTIRPLPKFRAGCTGLQHEFALSGYPYLMYRSAPSPLLLALPRVVVAFYATRHAKLIMPHAV